MVLQNRKRGKGTAERDVSLLRAFDRLEARLARQEALLELRLEVLERSQADQETRLRALGESVVRLTTSASLAQIAQAALALILSAIAAYLGSR
jgi:hypothetical protein